MSPPFWLDQDLRRVHIRWWTLMPTFGLCDRATEHTYDLKFHVCDRAIMSSNEKLFVYGN
jgi:hypothetical protein